MKELSIEEKAKAYDEALERAKEINREHSKNGFKPSDDVLYIFPDLKESEDERIRKKLIHLVTKSHEQGGYALHKDEAEDMIAWLKKQGEQKLNVNDNAKEMFIKALERVEEQNAKGYKLTDCDKNSWWEDFKNYTSCTIEQKPTGWSEKLIADVFEMVGLAKIVREQENDALTRALQFAMIELAKYSVVPQIRQEWSEEDDRMLDKCIKAACSNYYPGISSVRDWLKSLKERYAWKPSDLPHWKKSTLPDNTTGFNSDYFCYKGYNINYKELFEKLPKDN